MRKYEHPQSEIRVTLAPLSEVVVSFYNLSKCNVLAYFGNLYSHSFSLLRIGNDDNVSTLNTGNTVTLLPHILNFHLTGFSFRNRWFRWATFLRRFAFSFGCFRFCFRDSRQNRDPVRTTFFDIAEPDFLFRNFNDIRPGSFFYLSGKQAKQLV